MQVTATTQAPADTGADTVAVGMFEGGHGARRPGGRAPRGVRRGQGQAPPRGVDARRRAALAAGRSGPGGGIRRRGARGWPRRSPRPGQGAGRPDLCWAAPGGDERSSRAWSRARCWAPTASTATRRARTRTTTVGPARLVVSAEADVGRRSRRARVVAEAQNARATCRTRPQRHDAHRAGRTRRASWRTSSMRSRSRWRAAR